MENDADLIVTRKNIENRKQTQMYERPLALTLAECWLAQAQRCELHVTPDSTQSDTDREMQEQKGSRRPGAPTSATTSGLRRSITEIHADLPGTVRNFHDGNKVTDTLTRLQSRSPQELSYRCPCDRTHDLSILCKYEAFSNSLTMSLTKSVVFHPVKHLNLSG